MPFQIATLTWSARETTVSHDTFSSCKNLPWTIHTVWCAFHGHELSRSAWKLCCLNTLPDQSALPSSMTAKLIVVPDALPIAEQDLLKQHFAANRQVTLTVRMGSRSETLTVNLML